ncbi:MAG: metal ABC transporter permease, partial [Planctomycetota bacterium]
LSLVSVTTVAAFETAGTVLVVALMVTPAATANLFTHSLARMLVLSAVIGAACSVVGVLLGYWIEISPGGPIAATTGVFFLGSVLFAPRVGFIAQSRMRRSQQRDCLQGLTLQLLAKSGIELQPERSFADWVSGRISAPSRSVFNAVEKCRSAGWIDVTASSARLTSLGEARLEEMTQAT